MTPADGDTGPGLIHDHAWERRDPWWWSVCKTCGLAEAAHAETTRDLTRDDISAMARASAAEIDTSKGGFRG